MQIDLDILPWQLQFLQSKKTIKALSGASDTGKSWVCRFHLVWTSLQHPGSTHYCTATTWTQTYRAIAEPIMELLDEIQIKYNFFLNGSKLASKPFQVAEDKKSDGIIQFYNGSRIELFSSDKIFSRIKSREFSLGFIEEATEIPDRYMERIYPEAIRRLRQPGYPHHLLIATNPDIKTRWLYTNFFENPPEYAFVKKLSYKEGYNKDDSEREEKILMGSERQRQLYYNGEWGNLEGQAFVMRDGIDIQTVESEPNDRHYITFDYGFSPDPMVYLLCKIKNNVGYVMEEIVLKNIPVNRHRQWLDKWVSAYNIVGFTGETATGSGEIRELLRDQYKLRYFSTTKNRSTGWTTLSDLFDTNKLVINKKCPYTIRSLSSLCWVSSTRGVDVGGEYEDEADALRYWIMSPPVQLRLVKRFGERKVRIF